MVLFQIVHLIIVKLFLIIYGLYR